MNYQTFLQDLHAVRDRAGRFRRGADGEDQVGPALALALEELDVTLEELRVAEEMVRGQREALDDERARTELERRRYQVLFHHAPAPYLVTDPAAVIRQANLRAADLLGVHDRSVAGRVLTAYVHPEDRSRFRDLLARLPGTGGAEWRVLLRSPDRDRLQVVAWVAVDRDPVGVAQELRWLLWPSDGVGP